MVQPSTTRGPIGRCIYCGATSGKLTTEHVVPEALGGVHIMTRSSCDICRETLNHRVDKIAIRSLMQARAAYGFKSKRPKNRSITVIRPPDSPSFSVLGNTATYPVNGYSGSVILAGLSGPPGLLHPTGEPSAISLWADYKGDALMMDQPIVESANAIASMTAKVAFAAAIFRGYDLSPSLFSAMLRDPRKFVGEPSDTQAGPFKLPYCLSHRVDGDFLLSYVRYFTSAPLPYHFQVAMPLDII